jgi:hypothetical protein
MRLILLTACFLAAITICRAGDRNPEPLRAVATTDSTEVHPDDVFDVTLSLENLTNAVQKITIPDPAWDRVWRSSNRHVTWDFWDSDFNDQLTIEIPPHGSYVFPKPLKMFVDIPGKKSRMEFRMGFKTKAFGKTLWSTPISIDVTP